MNKEFEKVVLTYWGGIVLENDKWEMEELEKREEILVEKIKEKIDLF